MNHPMRIEEVVSGLPPTEKIYLRDSYIRTAEAKVLRAVKEKGRRYYVVLDASIFHPMGGGQPSDLGWLRGKVEFEVKKVLESRGVVVIYGKLLEGQLEGEVSQELDWERRYLIMRLHTAGHVIDRAVFKIFGETSTLGAFHGPPDAYVEYANRIDPFAADEIEKVANEILDDREVLIHYVSRDELDKFVYGAPNMGRLPELPVYRVVEVKGLNAIPCSGTHVRRTSEVGRIVVKGIELFEGGSRVHYWVSDS